MHYLMLFKFPLKLSPPNPHHFRLQNHPDDAGAREGTGARCAATRERDWRKEGLSSFKWIRRQLSNGKFPLAVALSNCHHLSRAAARLALVVYHRLSRLGSLCYDTNGRKSSYVNFTNLSAESGKRKHCLPFSTWDWLTKLFTWLHKFEWNNKALHYRTIPTH